MALSVRQRIADIARAEPDRTALVGFGTDLAEQLQRALNSRIAIEQAKGAVAERAGVDMDTAFGWLRTYARSNNMRLAVVAVAIVERALSIDALRTTPTRLPEQS